MATGKVFLVGAGPGTFLITVRGQRLLESADVVLYDALSHPALLELVSPHAELQMSASEVARTIRPGMDHAPSSSSSRGRAGASFA
jgi:siroheme synthase